MDDDVVVAVAWALYLPEDRAGYGFVDAATPEVCVWVTAEARGRGMGRTITTRLLERAADGGVRRVSLSVESGNSRAVALYRSLGFEPVPGRDADGVMLADLERGIPGR